jgi:hypothetical protein
MIIKLTLLGLIIILVAVIALSYYQNKECFEDITKPKMSECSGLCPKTMTSENGQYTLTTTVTSSLQGALELKDVSNNTVLWRQPQSSDRPSQLVFAPTDIPFQAGLNALTGEFGLYKTSDQSTVWKTDIANNVIDAPFKLVLQDDGNLVIKDRNDAIVWSTNTGKAPAVTTKTNECKVGTCPSLLETGMGHFKVMLQHDGTLKLQSMIPDIPDRIIAKAKDKGLNGPYTLSLTKYGNLLMLDKSNNQKNPVWSSNSYRADGDQVGTYRLVLAEDGSLTIRAGNGNGDVIWSASDAIPKPKPKPKPTPSKRRPSDDPDSHDRNSGSMPDRTDIDPDNTVSDTSSMAMALKYKSDLLKDLQKVVRNELIANRMTKRIESDDNEDDCNMNGDSDAMAQGREYGCHRQDTYRCPKNPDGSCPPVPDMSDFIKKDSIPCFGCSLDY